MNRTKIQWTNYSSNPLRYKLRNGKKTGWHCVKTSPGCRGCYAEAINRRFGTGTDFTVQSGPLVDPFVDVREFAAWERCRDRGALVFVEDMSDLFGEWVPFEMIFEVFKAMAKNKHLTFQVLTKRAERMHEFITSFWGRPIDNVWLGVSVEDQQRADQRIPWLCKTPAAVRFLSCEPLLGRVALTTWEPIQDSFCPRCGTWLGAGRAMCDTCGRDVLRRTIGVDWVIVGGESGPSARPMNLDWAREIVNDCRATYTPVFVKQLGGKRDHRGEIEQFPPELRVRKFPTR